MRTNAEIWKPVPGYIVEYEASTRGRLRSLPRMVRGRGGSNRTIAGRVVSPITRKDGRLSVSLWKNGRGVQRYLHCIILETFVGECPAGMQGCHFPDRTLSNCRSDNLRWDTPKNNQKDRIFHGTDLRGNKSPNRIVCEKQVREIAMRLLRGEPGHTIARNLGISDGIVGGIKRSETWRHLDLPRRHEMKNTPRRGLCGEKNPKTRLKVQDVRTIRSLYKSGNTTFAKLGIRFQTTAATIHRIVHNRVWRGCL